MFENNVHDFNLFWKVSTESWALFWKGYVEDKQVDSLFISVILNIF